MKKIHLILTFIVFIIICFSLTSCGAVKIKDIISEESTITLSDDAELVLTDNSGSLTEKKKVETISYTIANNSNSDYYFFGTGDDAILLVLNENIWYRTSYGGDCTAEGYTLAPGEQMNMEFHLGTHGTSYTLPAGTYRLVKNVEITDSYGARGEYLYCYFEFTVAS